MESYHDFSRRISYQQAELQLGEGRFVPDGRVHGKVNRDNRFKPFYGDTVIFDLDDGARERISSMIDRLYAAAGECFCERIASDTIHMTLHDLSASDTLEKVATEVFDNEIDLLRVLHNNPPDSQTIRMKTNFIINMVNTSLVLALVPADEREWDKLQALYSLIDQVRVCPYPYLTPHITLAYFNYEGFREESAEKLKEAVRLLNKKRFEITLSTDALFYKKFISMNDYISVFRFA